MIFQLVDARDYRGEIFLGHVLRHEDATVMDAQWTICKGVV